MTRKSSNFRWKALSQRQKQVLSWWTPQSAYSDYNGIVADGAIRSGKTFAMGFSFVQWGMACFDGQQFAMCGKTILALRRNVLNTLKRQLQARGYSIKEHRADNCWTVSKGGRTNEFYFFGGKDEGSQDLIQGITLAGAFFDEVALMPQSFVNQATARCSVTGSKFWFNCNPGNPQHWFYIEWLCKVRSRRLVYLHFTMDDNLSLDESIKERYRRQYTGVFYQRYILGLWVAAEGVIYRDFAAAISTPDNRFLWPADLPLRPWRVRVGVDFGGNGSKHAFVATALLPGFRGVVGLASQRVEPKGQDADFLADALIEFCMAVFARWGEIQFIFCDSAEQTLINHIRARLRRCKLPWLAERVENSAKIKILDRIRLTSILMGGGRFWYLPEAATLRDALATALWSQKHPGMDERLDDGSTDIDTLDAFEYTIERDYKRLTNT